MIARQDHQLTNLLLIIYYFPTSSSTFFVCAPFSAPPIALLTIPGRMDLLIWVPSDEWDSPWIRGSFSLPFRGLGLSLKVESGWPVVTLTVIWGCADTPDLLHGEYPLFQWRPGKPQCPAAHPLSLRPEPPAPRHSWPSGRPASHTLFFFQAPTLARCPVTCGSICPPIFVSRQQHTITLGQVSLPCWAGANKGLFPHPRTEEHKHMNTNGAHTWTQRHTPARAHAHALTCSYTII